MFGVVVEEAPGSVEEKKMVKAPEKKSGGKGKSPLGAKAVAVVVVEKAEEVAEETLTSIVVPILEVMESKEGNKPGQELNLEPVLDYKDAAGGEEQRMEEDSEVVAVEEAVEGDEVVEEEAGGEGEGEGDEGDDDKGARMEEQIEISNMAKARMIKKEQEIFVGGLDRDAVEDDLKKVFERVGEVVEIRLHKDFNTNKNKGFAFVKFASKEQAAKALTELKNPMVSLDLLLIGFFFLPHLS